MLTIEPDGRVVFSVFLPLASTVEVVGDFAGWHDQVLALAPSGGGEWRGDFRIRPGTCLFRYLIDGERWILDEHAHGLHVTADGVIKSRAWTPPAALDPDALAA